MCQGAIAASAGAPETARPQWSLLYWLALVTPGLLGGAELVPLLGVWRTAVRSGLALGGFAAMAWWVWRNRVALDQEDWCACAGQRTTVRVIPSRRPAPAPIEAPARAEPEDAGLLVGAGRS